MGDGRDPLTDPWGTEFLTSAQAELLEKLDHIWATATGPTLIRLVGPEYRGKTHVVQVLLERLIREHVVNGFPTGHPTDFPWRQMHDWRTARRAVESTTSIARITSGWMWCGCRLAPEVPSDLLGNLRRIASETLQASADAWDGGADDVLGSSGADWAKLVAKSSIQLSLEQVPYLGTVRAIADAGRAFRTLRMADRDATTAELFRDLDRDLPRDLLTLMAIARLGSPFEGAALPRLLLVIDDAHLLRQADFKGLSDLLSADPDELLSASDLPDGLKRTLRGLGMPPRFPVVVLLVQSTSTRGEDVFGPLESTLKSQPQGPAPIDDWIAQLEARPERVPLHRLDGFPLFTEDEAERVAARFEPRISARTRSMVLARSHDSYLGGHNIALLRSHLDRLSDLTDPNAIDASWVDRHLPLQLQAEVQEMVAGLSRPARRALVASSLIGFGFAGSSVGGLLDHDCSAGLSEAEDRGLIAAEARGRDELDDTFYLYADSMTHSYAYELGASDRDLSVRALDRKLMPKARNVLNWAYPGASREAMQVAELARGTCWEYRQLAENAGVGPEDLARDVWGAALTLTADHDILLSNMGDNAAQERLSFLWALGDESRGAAESSGAWAMIRRWHIHRYTPGWLTYGSLYASAKAGQSSETVTRCIPEAHAKAAELASQHFTELRDTAGVYGWFDVHLLYRLGPYVRLVDEQVRRELVKSLLLLGTVSPTAAQYMASELWDDADEQQRAGALLLLEGWSSQAHGRDTGRSAAILAIRSESPMSKDALSALRDSFLSGPNAESMFSDFEGTGSLRLGTAPMVYPWLGFDVLIPYALSRAAERQHVAVSDNDILRRLWKLKEAHPSAAAILQSRFARSLSREQNKRLRKVARSWMRTHLVGHGEQAALPVLEQQ